jgi:hypothetical protein
MANTVPTMEQAITKQIEKLTKKIDPAEDFDKRLKRIKKIVLK